MRPAMIVHGGAGSRRARDEVLGYPREIENAVKVGVEALRSGSSLEGVQAVVEYMEEAEVFSAGRGSPLTSDGRLQLDAAVMVGGRTARSTVNVYLSFFSTQFYPASFLPPPVRILSAANPMTRAVESFRALGSGMVDLSVIASLAVLSVVLLTAGYVFYIRSMIE